VSTLVVLQPGYLPWLGFFDQLLRSDVFVYYDDVQFDKHGWRNRNRIKSATGPLWLTVPILHSGRHGQRILDVEIDNRRPWAKKQLASISQCYAKAPFLSRYFSELERALLHASPKLAELDIALVDLMCKWIGIERRIVRSSRLGVEGGQSERLVNLCKEFGADRYISGDAAKDYLDVPMFAASGVTVEWQSYQHPTYAQLHGDFVPYLSALDLVLNVGPDSLGVLKRSS
jgi:WbqC-like protein family